ncbi:MAG: UDP-3-O-acyl-N-acetylglucosamine deacetylase [Spartobacteria bacterium]|nr:UDP-3-O-acyl-N-acetylglucosamine deacetylase [Spartobacteria bacterium]
MKQKTLQSEVRCSGIGLHGGAKIEMVVKPAPADTGIVFVLVGSESFREIKLDPKSVTATGLATTLGYGDAHVSTVEHLLATMVGLEIDNAIIEVHGGEIPILDGSAAVFVHLFRSVGLRELHRPKRIAKIKRHLVFEDGEKRITVSPYPGLKIDYTISFSHPQIGRQQFFYESSPKHFIEKISRARTFGFLRDVELLQKRGLARGGSLENAVVFDEYGVVNPEGLRFSDEMVRHKILDFMGDIAVYSARLWGHFEVSCSGHDFNNKFMRFLDGHAAEYIDVIDLSSRPQSVQHKTPSFGGIPVWA